MRNQMCVQSNQMIKHWKVIEIMLI